MNCSKLKAGPCGDPEAPPPPVLLGSPGLLVLRFRPCTSSPSSPPSLGSGAHSVLPSTRGLGLCQASLPLCLGCGPGRPQPHSIPLMSDTRGDGRGARWGGQGQATPTPLSRVGHEQWPGGWPAGTGPEAGKWGGRARSARTASRAVKACLEGRELVTGLEGPSRARLVFYKDGLEF